MHELVLAGAARPRRRVPFRWALDQELLGATDARLVLAQRVPLDDIYQARHPRVHDISRDELVGEQRRLGARAR